MGFKLFFSFMFFLLVVILLVFYWFVPFRTSEFSVKIQDSYKEPNITYEALQFYPNMRYPDSGISYKIYDCTLQKENDMERAFGIISAKTILNFYPVEEGEEISVTCESRNVINEGLFVAGEGGPSNISKSGKYNVILNGQILLLKESECENPNVAIHELLHALGFEHSSSRNDIMYPVSNCKQIINQETINVINELYSVPSYPDLVFENVSAIMRGKYLDLNFSIRNNGFKDSGDFAVYVFTDEDFFKKIEIEKIELGYGRSVMWTNMWVKKINVNEISLFIDSGFNEIDTSNNKISLRLNQT